MSKNFFKTAVLLTVLTVLLVVLGDAVAGSSGMLVALLFAGAMNFFSYWYSDKIVLTMSGAREVAYEDAPDLYRVVGQVAEWARIPRPRIYVILNESPNAFATGRDPSHAAVAVTTGILDLLSERELAGVLAHELGHVRNRDTLIMTVVATVAGAITLIANMAQWALFLGGFGRTSDDREGTNPFAALLMIIVAPIVAMLIQLAISRAREYDADATGARISGDPLALASALEKLEQQTAEHPLNPDPAMAHLFIVNPFSGRGLQSLFMTHPPIGDRVERLRAMAVRPMVVSY